MSFTYFPLFSDKHLEINEYVTATVVNSLEIFFFLFVLSGDGSKNNVHPKKMASCPVFFLGFFVNLTVEIDCKFLFRTSNFFYCHGIRLFSVYFSLQKACFTLYTSSSASRPQLIYRLLIHFMPLPFFYTL